MKIMLVSRVITAHRPGGMPHVATDRAEALAALGHEVHLITSAHQDPGHPGHTWKCLDGLKTHYCPDGLPQQWSREFADFCLSWHRDLKPDVLHLDSMDTARPWWADLGAAVTMHGFGWGAFLTQWNLWRSGQHKEWSKLPTFDATGIAREAQVLAKARVVLGVSKHEHRMLRDQYGLRQAKLVYNPIAPCFFQPARAAGQRQGFLAVAASQPATRGFDLAQRAARRAGVRLAVVSGVSRQDLPAVYDRAQALVLPTAFGTGFDLAVCEARARGCPAVLAAQGSYLDEAEGWDRLVELGDEEGLAEALAGWVPRTVPPDHPAVARHRPEAHARAWLAAVAG